MRKFDYSKLNELSFDAETINYLSKINQYKGKQELYIRQKPLELERLVQVARIQSTESSNSIEGIRTTNSRIKQLLIGKTSPKTRDEEEIIGYRDVLDLIHSSYEEIKIVPNHILQLHKILLSHTNLSYGGNFKNVQNYITDTYENGETRIRFTPLSPFETPDAIAAICESYNRTIKLELIDPLILIPVFITDFLCIHPFNDGNGRMSRLLTLLLLYQNDFLVGKFISIEKQIEKSKNIYYDVLEKIDYEWREEKNDPTPFIKYYLKVILAAYKELDERISLVNEKGSKNNIYDVVKKYCQNKIGRFTSADVIRDCPSGGRSRIFDSLKKLVDEGIIERKGSGRSSYYVKVESQENLLANPKKDS